MPLTLERSKSLVSAFSVLPMLRSLDALYPGFDHWYVNTVVPGVVTGDDTLLVAREGARTVGVALGKRQANETKLRCVRVLPEYQASGLGIRLIDRMLEELECDKPACSVAEEMLHSYSRAFVTRYGFSLDDVRKGAYRAGRLEYYFNQ